MRARGHGRRAAVGLLVAVLPALVLPLLGPATPGRADDTPAQARAREQRAAAALEDSTSAVRSAASALADVAAQLPGARADAATARGELDGARARAAAAQAAADRAARTAAAAAAQVTAASARVDAGRAAVGRLARSSYSRGPMADLAVLTTGSPQDLLDRSALLQQVFRSQNDSLAVLSDERLALARTQHARDQEQDGLEAARAEAGRVERRAQQSAREAQAAQDRVSALVAERGRVLTSAQSSRAADLAAYRQAQRESRALAERIRQAALARARALAAARARARAQAAARLRAQARAAAAARAARRPVPKAPPAPSVAAEPAPPRAGQWLWPADGPLTSPFGWRVHPIFGDLRFHAGIDIGAPYGAPVHAAAAGVVTYAGPASGYGTLILVSHGTRDGVDITTGYAHQSALLVSVGQEVAQGQQVGAVGNEGNSTGPHLHFEVRVDGDPVDPLGYVSPP